MIGTSLSAAKAHKPARAISIQLSRQSVKQISLTRNAMILLAIVMLGAALATHARAAEGSGNGAGLNAGLQGGHIRGGFDAPVFDRAPSMPAPAFNQSEPFTVPQSPEAPVSPASPGSVFGN